MRSSTRSLFRFLSAVLILTSHRGRRGRRDFASKERFCEPEIALQLNSLVCHEATNRACPASLRLCVSAEKNSIPPDRCRICGGRSASCDLALQGSSLHSSGNPTPSARANFRGKSRLAKRNRIARQAPDLLSKRHSRSYACAQTSRPSRHRSSLPSRNTPCAHQR